MIARYKNSFFPEATSSWNNMISNFQDIPTFTSLKSHLLVYMMHVGLRYFFQLRVNLPFFI